MEWATVYNIHAEAARTEHDQVIGTGGLFILGTERHESRRVDNQLRGRAGRQGDPGESRFYLSLEDDLIRIFAKQWMSSMMQRMGMKEDEPIESKMITKRIEGAQKAVEAQNFESRKHLLEYDDVMNKQREAVYGLRRQLLEGVEQKELILEDYVGGILSGLLDEFAGEKVHPDQWDMKGLDEKLTDHFGLKLASLNIGGTGINPQELSRHELGEAIFEKLKEQYDAKERILSAATMRYHERMVMLSVIDGLWKDHLLSMDHLKEGIGLRGYAQTGPAGGIQARVLRHVRGDDAEVPGGHGPVPLPDADSGPGWAAGGCRAAAEANGSACAAGGQRCTPADAGCGRRERLRFRRASPRPPSTRWRRSSSARRSGNWRRPADRAETRASPRSAGRARRWGATIPAPAAAGKSTRSATGRGSSFGLVMRIPAPKIRSWGIRR